MEQTEGVFTVGETQSGGETLREIHGNTQKETQS
jgi:hypothetical protein